MSSGSSAWEGQLTSLVLSEYASTEMSIHALYMHEVNVFSIIIHTGQYNVMFIITTTASVFLFTQLHKQQSRGDLSRHTWHRQESDESSDSIPDEVRSHNPQSRHFPRSHTFPTTVSSPTAIPASASDISSTAIGQEGVPSLGGSHQQYSESATGTSVVTCVVY